MRWTLRTQYLRNPFYVIPCFSILIHRELYGYRVQCLSFNFNWLNYHINLAFFTR